MKRESIKMPSIAIREGQAQTYTGASLRNDDLFVPNELRSTKELTGYPARSGYEQALISNGKIVNFVSAKYGHLDNEHFFGEIERKLNESKISFLRQSINHEDRSFAADYILQDDSLSVKVKEGNQTGDEIRPMMRFTSSYDGSALTSGHFGFFRKVCDNGLHIADTEIGFKIKKTGNVQQLVLPKIEEMIAMFIDNKYYSLHRKFEVLAETPIKDLSKFTRDVCAITGLLNFAKSEKNPDSPSKNAQLIMDTITNEAGLLHTEPNMWIGYNAFNAFIHQSFNDDFDKQKEKDEYVFNVIHNLRSVLN